MAFCFAQNCNLSVGLCPISYHGPKNIPTLYYCQYSTHGSHSCPINVTILFHAKAVTECPKILQNLFYTVFNMYGTHDLKPIRSQCSRVFGWE